MVAVAELEAGMDLCTHQGGARGSQTSRQEAVKPAAKMRALSTAALQQRSAARAADIAPAIKALQEAGATTLRAIAAGLNERGIPTARGDGQWSAVQVKRVLERL